MRLQIELDQGGVLQAVLPDVPDTGTVRLTVKRNTGLDLEDAAVVDVVLADPWTRTLAAGASGLVGGREITTVGLALADFPEKGAVLQARSVLGGQTQELRVRDVNATLQRIYLREPLTLSLTTSDTLHGVQATYTLLAANTPTVEQNFRALFSATRNGVRMVSELIFDVGLRPSGNPCKASDLVAAWPDVARADLLEKVATGADDALASGADAVEASLFAKGRNPNRLRDVTPLKRLVINRAMRHMALYGLVPTIWTEEIVEWLEELDTTYTSELNMSLAGMQWYDDDDDGVVDGEHETNPPAFDIQLGR